MSTSFELLQADARAVGLTNEYVSPISFMIQNDPVATVELVKNFDDRWEKALAESGLVIVVLTPIPKTVAKVQARGRSVQQMEIAFLITENPLRNRAPDGLQKPPLRILYELMKTLQLSEYYFEGVPFGQVDMSEDLQTHYLRCFYDVTI